MNEKQFPRMISASRLECLWLVIYMAYWMLRRLWLPDNLTKRHWNSCSWLFLVDRLDQEVTELNSSVSWDEAADVANFAAMIADRQTRKKMLHE